MPSIFDDFLEYTDEQGQRLAADSDVMRLTRQPHPGVGLWVAEFDVPYLHLRRDGAIDIVPGPVATAIHFGPSYLSHVSPLEVVQVREIGIFHPNIRWPVMCVGHIHPGMPLPQVLRQIYEIMTYQNFATDDGLDPVACRRLCEEPHLVDLLPPPKRLVRRQLELSEESL